MEGGRVGWGLWSLKCWSRDGETDIERRGGEKERQTLSIAPRCLIKRIRRLSAEGIQMRNTRRLMALLIFFFFFNIPGRVCVSTIKHSLSVIAPNWMSERVREGGREKKSELFWVLINGMEKKNKTKIKISLQYSPNWELHFFGFSLAYFLEQLVRKKKMQYHLWPKESTIYICDKSVATALINKQKTQREKSTNWNRCR